MSEHLALTLSGMTCQACAALIQDELRDTPGVVRAEVSFERRRAEVEFEAERVAVAELLRRVSKLGYQAAPA
jgi:copper chaperone CopZ